MGSIAKTLFVELRHVLEAVRDDEPNSATYIYKFHARWTRILDRLEELSWRYTDLNDESYEEFVEELLKHD